ncbi:MAG: PilZ domain-containing protein [Opitutae bacterium]
MVELKIPAMLFFKRILKDVKPAAGAVPPVERRSLKRYGINPHFPIKAVLSYSGPKGSHPPLGAPPKGWHWKGRQLDVPHPPPSGTPRKSWQWKGRLLDCSERGARIQMGPTLTMEARDLCHLKLTVEEFELTVPCHITNIREHDEGLVFGLRQDIADETTGKAFGQLIEVLALGSTLKLHGKTTEPDNSGYLVEHYVSNRPARLSVWRHATNEAVTAFEFQLKDNLVRAAAGHGMQYLVGTPARSATPAQAEEIKRLFNWVVPNLAAAVPEDVRKFLHRYAV